MTPAEYYRDQILALLPPGAFATHDGSVVHSLAAGCGAVLGRAEEESDQFGLEVVPQTAEELLSSWETYLDSPYQSGADAASRQAVLTAMWRLAIGPRLYGLRSVLEPLLQSAYQFRDTCDKNVVSWRYENIAGGSGLDDEDNTRLRVRVQAGGDSRWNNAVKEQHLRLLPLIDRDDSYTIELQLLGDGLNNDTAAGLVLYGNDENAYLFGPHQSVAGVRELARTRILDNYFSVASPAVAISTSPPWLVLERDANAKTVTFKYGASLAALNTLVTMEEMPFTVKKIGMFCINGTGFNEGYILIDDVQIRYEKPHNNIEIIETPLSNIVSGQEAQKFFFFVHRDPADGGTYDLPMAQHALDRAKSGHTLGIIGESDCFRWDDPYSLWARDIWS